MQKIASDILSHAFFFFFFNGSPCNASKLLRAAKNAGFLLATVSSFFLVAKALRGFGCPAAACQSLRWMMTEAAPPAVCARHVRIHTLVQGEVSPAFPLHCKRSLLAPALLRCW